MMQVGAEIGGILFERVAGVKCDLLEVQVGIILNNLFLLEVKHGSII
jgi:hypothetical protein